MDLIAIHNFNNDHHKFTIILWFWFQYTILN